MTATRLALPCALALCAISACGGSAFTSNSEGTGGADGGMSSGGASSGGVNAAGGAVTTGGASATGGSKAAGGTSGGARATGGASATGGSNAAGGMMTTGGTSATGGAAARGGSASSGGATSSGGAGGQSSFDACTASSQCTLVPAGCCGACEPSKLSDFVAINSARANDYALTRSCTNVLCAACPAPLPETTQSGNYGARCVNGHCQAFDVRTTELSACADSTQCVLRVGVRCCEGCSGGLAAVSTKADLQQALCGDSSGMGGPVACPACAPILPSNASASCGLMGHCAVTWTGVGTD